MRYVWTLGTVVSVLLGAALLGNFVETAQLGDPEYYLLAGVMVLALAAAASLEGRLGLGR